jgi:uncharacterized protein
MALLFFDSSAFVKLMIKEDGSKLAIGMWNSGDAVFASRLAYPEVRAALAAAHRNHVLDDERLHNAESSWNGFWASVRPVELTARVEQHAGRLAREHSLKGTDAVHLASALTIDDPGLVVAVWDRRLHSSVRAAGAAVAPAELKE